MISKLRKKATSNPFIIYEFYELVEELVRSHNLGPHQILNVDEAGFSHDPASCRVVEARGKVSFKMIHGPGRDNTTVLASCNAEGSILPPMIVFKGKNFQSTWTGNIIYE